MEEIVFPTKIVEGNDALKKLSDYKSYKAFIVADPFVVESKTIDQVTKHLQDENYIVYSDIIPDPPIEKVISGMNEMEAFHAEIMIAIGGGSAIDAAKAMKFFSEKIFHSTILAFIAIPTTSGTGSEVTNFSVITNSELGIKYPLVADSIQPTLAILDTNLVLTVPPTITADTGMDVLTHAIEAYVSTKSSIISDALCEKVVKLVFENLEEAYQHGETEKARENMHLASAMAGMAFNQASLGLNHGIAHAAGARFHVPHGRMNAILLPEVIRFNADIQNGKKNDWYIAKRYMALANCIGETTTNPRLGVQNLIRAIKDLRRKLKLPASLNEYGIATSEVRAAKSEVAQAAMNDGCTATNPRVPTQNEVEHILEQIS
ncbi:MAG: iron-containing alcohol dehydrogenase [Lactobacillales bacterium]|jgi:alcohol dehydrogenase class IV|nr:iron-containing alcohol dehydrogenase [Lactobacillales bacterium]